jgi:dephospho-CoA kinase
MPLRPRVRGSWLQMVIGVTGGIGSGKSTVTRLLAEFGAIVIDADRVGHDVYEPGTKGWESVVEEFGRGIIADNGKIDRGKLGALVFADPQRLARLNQLVHPLIGGEILRRIEEQRTRGGNQPIVVEAAVMIEAGWHSLVDEVWVVVANREAVLSRIGQQRGLNGKAAVARINAQISDTERCRHADIVIDNSGTPEDLRRKLEEIWKDRVHLP